MMNYFNSRQPWSPEGRNLLNSEGWEGYNGEFDYRPEVDDPLHPWRQLSAANRYGDVQPTYVDAAARDDAMPVFKPGAVSSEREPWQPSAKTNFPQRPAGVVDDREQEIAREDAMEELPPFVSVGDSENWPYWKTRDGATLKEIAAIAQTQYPGATVRIGQSGRPIIAMPSDTTRLKVRPINDWGSGPLERENIGGQEFQLDAPGVTLRDVVNGGSQMAEKIVGTVSGMLIGGNSGLAKILRANPLAAAAYGAWKGYDLTEQGRKDRVRRNSGLP